MRNYFAAARALRTKARSLAGSFLPGESSTPEATSTPQGAEQTDCLGYIERGESAGGDNFVVRLEVKRFSCAAFQSKVVPVPPTAVAVRESMRMASMDGSCVMC